MPNDNLSKEFHFSYDKYDLTNPEHKQHILYMEKSIHPFCRNNPDYPSPEDGFGITPEIFQQAVNDRKVNFPFYQTYIGYTNPYTGTKIQNKDDFLQYYREFIYYRMCHRRALNYLYGSSKDYVLSAYRKHTDRIEKLEKVEAEQSKTIEALKSENKKQRKRFVVSMFCSLILVFALILSIMIPSSEESSPAPTSTPKVSVTERTSVTSSQSKTSNTRAAPIASGYIGNRNTKKYHRSTCSYLPDQSNQIVFDDPEEAEAAGYSPCGKCRP